MVKADKKPNRFTTVQILETEKDELLDTAAQTALRDNQSGLSIRQLILKMHAKWRKEELGLE